MLRLLRLTEAKLWLNDAPSSSRANGGHERIWSPVGGSTLTTSAPRSASSIPANGPGGDVGELDDADPGQRQRAVQEARGGRGSVGELLADQRQQVAAVVDGVVERVVAADQHGVDADVDVVEERLRRPSPACRPARWSCRRRRSALAVGVHRQRSCTSPFSAAASSRCEPAFCGRLVLRVQAAHLLRNCCPTAPLMVSRIRCARSQASSSVRPRIGRNETQMRGCVGAPGRRGRCSHDADLLAGLRQRLAPEHVGVGVLARRPGTPPRRSRRRRARDARSAYGRDLGGEALEPVVAARRSRTARWLVQARLRIWRYSSVRA